MSAQSDAAAAKRFAAAYRPSDSDHPDLSSRVVMYQRAVEDGDKRKVAAHARTLVRFIGHLGLDVPKARPARKSASGGNGS